MNQTVIRLLLSGLVALAIGGALASAEDNKASSATVVHAAEKSDPGTVQRSAPATAPAKDPGPAREEMLERLADQMSRRMQSLREREAALSAREEALAAREKRMEERERHLGDLEALIQSREEAVRRRLKLPPPQSWKGPPAPEIHGRYAAVIDGRTLQFYHAKEAGTRTPVASTQKLVTAQIVCAAGDLDGYAEVPGVVEEIEPTKIGIQPGERYTRRELLHSLLIRSGNDVAATLAIDNAGSIEAFAGKMNRFARSIGMRDSHFVNPHGLPAEGQHSTARDMAIAAFEAYQVPEIREIVRKKTHPFVFNDGSERVLYNTNKVLGRLPGCNGMKTGFTYAAGNCLVSSAQVEGEDRIAVIIKSDGAHIWEDSRRLLEWSLGLEMGGSEGLEEVASRGEGGGGGR